MRAIALLFVLMAFGVHGQVVFDRVVHNFGLIEGDDTRFTDFVVTNKSDTEQVILSVRSDREVSFLISDRVIAPDSSQVIRIQINPYEEGLFSKTIDVYISISEEPFKLKINGIAKNLAEYKRQQCPDFSDSRQRSAHYIPRASVKITVLDEVTGRGVANAMVKLNKNGLTENLQSNREGIAAGDVEAGLYSVACSAAGYNPQTRAVYFSRTEREYMVKLLPENGTSRNILFNVEEENKAVKITVGEKKEEVVVPDAGVSENEEIRRVDTIAPLEMRRAVDMGHEQASPGLIVPPVRPDPPAIPSTNDSPDFSVKEYSPNNIVFLVDRSSSMNDDQKLWLLKQAMLKLLEMLRPVDYLSIVSYSTHAEVLLAPVKVDNKKEIASKINSLVASGTTQAAKGITQAYAIADSMFLANGNNEIFLATDGAFARGTSKIYPMIGRHGEQGVRLSVIGIKNEDWTVKQLQEITALGKGSYIPLKTKKDAERALIEQVKKNSLINKDN